MAQFIPTRTIRFQKNNFQTVLSMAFPTDGWHLIPLNYLIQGEGDYQVDEGGELVSFVVEAAGESEIDYDALLKCRVIDGVVDTIYTPGVMGADDRLFLVSGENRFPIEYNKATQRFSVGNLTGKLTEREYDKADGSKGKSVLIQFTPNNPDLKVIYLLPLVLKKWEDIVTKLPEGAIISQELFDWILSEEWVDTEEQGQGVKWLSALLLQTLGGAGNTGKLPELGIGSWVLKDWVKQEPKKFKDGEKPYPPNYQLFLETFDGVPLSCPYYSNKAISDQLNSMSKVFKAYILQGRKLQLKITSIYKVGQYDAAKATILLLPPDASATGMKSASVADPQLPQSRATGEFTQALSSIDVVAVKADTVLTNVVEVVDAETDFDNIPF